MPNPNELGSAGAGSPTNDSDLGAGRSTVTSEQYKELETKIGTQGQ